MKRIAPGVYDNDGTLHFVIPEMLEAEGYPVTTETVVAIVVALEKAARDIARQWGLPLEIRE